MARQKGLLSCCSVLGFFPFLSQVSCQPGFLFMTFLSAPVGSSLLPEHPSRQSPLGQLQPTGTLENSATQRAGATACP